VATTSSGPFRRPSFWIAGAAAVTAVALIRMSEPGGDSAAAAQRSTQATATADVVTRRAQSTRTHDSRPQYDELRLSASAVERTLVNARPGTVDLILARDLAAWTLQDAPAAARFAELQSDLFLREVALRTVAQHWVRSDANAAARWADAMPSGAERDRTLESVALVLADTAPGSALQVLARRDAVPDPDATLAGVIANWAGRDFAAAQAWLEAQPPGTARDQIAQHLAVMRAGDDPLAATRIVDRMITGVETRGDAWTAIAQRWSAHDPDGMREWARSRDSDTQRRVDTELALSGASAWRP
jgi:hypothetical protein